ncbi:MAG TPA: hypothetical protein PK126_04715, partial [Candidatus Syntrophosphaera thermopropionivorans]|nr:hypothetical protein [Candidatus Syntrophosphaera thermopropionivorans]
SVRAYFNPHPNTTPFSVQSLLSVGTFFSILVLIVQRTKIYICAICVICVLPFLITFPLINSF